MDRQADIARILKEAAEEAGIHPDLAAAMVDLTLAFKSRLDGDEDYRRALGKLIEAAVEGGHSSRFDEGVQMKAYLDYLPPTTSASKALLGDWKLTITGEDNTPVETLLADQKCCLDRAKALGLEVVWSDRARRAAWAVFRKTYGRK